MRNSFSPGTKEWLIGTEELYGGYHSNVQRRIVSKSDPRSRKVLNEGGMIGGDRMLRHGYAKYYAYYLDNFTRSNKRKEITICEIGILRGTGLAIWCDLFPNDRVIGLDIDISHFSENSDTLSRLGAFRFNKPEIYQYDQLNPNKRLINTLFSNSKISICIDDGLHSIESIIMTLNSLLPYLADDFVYFIEDNDQIGKSLLLDGEKYKLKSHGQLAVISSI